MQSGNFKNDRFAPLAAAGEICSSAAIGYPKPETAGQRLELSVGCVLQCRTNFDRRNNVDNLVRPVSG